MRYLLINPFPSARRNGVTSYVQNVMRLLEEHGVAATSIANDAELPQARYRERVRDAIVTEFRPDEVLIEAPEVGAATLLLPPEYHVHVRLHTPTAFVARHNRERADLKNFQNELHVAATAHVASSPSHALLRELQPHLDVSRIHVYKNPPPDLPSTGPEPKTHDVVFMGNFSRLKGADFLNPLLCRFPAHYSVVMVGRYSDGFRVAPEVRCRVRIGEHLPGPDRLALLAGARVALTLSRFENCSMMVLESLAAGTVVAGWRVGGHAEIAGPRLVRLVDLGNLDALASTIAAAVEGPYPDADEFRAAVARVRQDFTRGWSRIWAMGTGAAVQGVYRGLDHVAVTA